MFILWDRVKHIEGTQLKPLKVVEYRKYPPNTLSTVSLWSSKPPSTKSLVSSNHRISLSPFYFFSTENDKSNTCNNIGCSMLDRL